MIGDLLAWCAALFAATVICLTVFVATMRRILEDYPPTPARKKRWIVQKRKGRPTMERPG